MMVMIDSQVPLLTEATVQIKADLIQTREQVKNYINIARDIAEELDNKRSCIGFVNRGYKLVQIAKLIQNHNLEI